MASTIFNTPITYYTPARLRRMCRYMNIANDLSKTQAELVTALNA